MKSMKPSKNSLFWTVQLPLCGRPSPTAPNGDIHFLLTPKIIAQDSGHVCQNLYLACEAIQAGTCAIGAYDQDKMDAVLQVDGQEEFAIYCAPVGKLKTEG